MRVLNLDYAVNLVHRPALARHAQPSSVHLQGTPGRAVRGRGG